MTHDMESIERRKKVAKSHKGTFAAQEDGKT